MVTLVRQNNIYIIYLKKLALVYVFLSLRLDIIDNATGPFRFHCHLENIDPMVYTLNTCRHLCEKILSIATLACNAKPKVCYYKRLKKFQETQY